MDKLKTWPWLALALLLAGCQATPYQRQSLRTPAQWTQQGEAGQDMGREAWWGGFGDPALLEVLQRVRKRNPDLEIALLKLRKAQLEAGLADGDARPTLSGSLSGNRIRSLDGGGWSRSHSEGLKVAYEVDLWGGWMPLAARRGKLSSPAVTTASRPICCRMARRPSCIGTSPLRKPGWP
ncbi:hypothetical protein A203_20875 [Chromobacterium violaceum]|uniref:hypothetical protein n=1 Tax=Chromobacterium violaceum TaxID=536 RepID=UPI003CE6CD3B